MHPSYSDMLCVQNRAIRETSSAYLYVTERHLQAIWFEQKYFKNLKTIEGNIIEVISPGIWNSEAGPDFKKAHLRIGGKEIKGDVEIHLSEAGWEQHNHQTDSRYNDVVFHLSLWGSNKILSTLHGSIFHRTILEPFLTIPMQRIINYIDLDLYPYKKFLGAGRCASALFQNLESKKIETFFKQAAEWRLVQKRSHLFSRTTNHADALIAGISTALGYKKNSESFLELYFQLKRRIHESFDELLAFALEITGFFDSKFEKKWGKSKFYNSLLLISKDKSTRIPLVLNQIRPMNHPVRRIVYLIKLLKHPQLTELYPQMVACWKEKDFKNMRNRMTDIIPSFEDLYWNSHYLFEDEPRNEFIPLIGNGLKEEMLINTLLPLLYDEVLEKGDPSEIEEFRLFYSSFSPLKSGKTKYLIHRFFGDSAKGTLLNKAYTEQGAYQVHKDFCIHYEASCEGCPFVDRFKTLFK